MVCFSEIFPRGLSRLIFALSIFCSWKTLLSQVTEHTLVESDSIYCKQYYLLKTHWLQYDSLARFVSQQIILIPDKEISQGMIHPIVANVRKRLEQEGYSETEVTRSDSFDLALRETILRFQKNNGCELTAKIDKQTVSVMNVTFNSRCKQIDINLNRWKNMPPDPGRCYISVNIADFRLDAVDSNTTVLSMKIIVGRLYRKTPVIYSQLSQIVFNPEWSVPKNILLKDLLPEIKKDPLYLQKHHMCLYRYDKNGLRIQVEDSLVNWPDLSANFPYTVVQDPGPWNALGAVKFLFPNSYDVYMHDTPTKELFASREPAYSSGCIRLSKAMDLAEYLLQKENITWTRDKFEQISAKGETNYTIALRQQIPLYINYFTAWVDEKGTLQFRKDIYDKDQSELIQKTGGIPPNK